MKKKVMRFEGEEQIHNFINTYPNASKLMEGLELFNIPEKCIHHVTVKKEKASNMYVIQFYTDQGILSLQEERMM